MSVDPGGPAYAHVDWSKPAPVEPTLPALLAYGARTFGGEELLVLDAERLTYEAAEQRSLQLAAALLRAGVGRSARVGILLPNGADFVVSWLAIVRIGAVAVPVSTLSSGPELARICRDAGFQILLSSDRFLSTDGIALIESALGPLGGNGYFHTAHAPHLSSVWLWRGTAPWSIAVPLQSCSDVDASRVRAAEALVTPADPATIVYTSGSTAAPKGVIHSQAAFMRASRRWAASMIYRRGDRHFSVSPMFWVGGLVTSLLTVMQVGATLVSSSRRDGSVLDVIEAERCTSIQVWPHLSRMIAEDPSFMSRDLSAIRGATVLAAVPPERRPRNPNPFGFAMGMTETAGPHTLAMGNIDDGHVGAMGLLAPGMEYRIVDPESGAGLPEGERGELLLRGDSMMLGYTGREPAEVFTPEGWFRTGDICSIRDDYIFFHGRRDAMFKTAGANVAPAEVEAALMLVDGVAEAHVLPVPDEDKGHVVGAIVVAKSGVALLREEVIAAVKPLLSSYKVPRRLLVVDMAPSTGTNKLDRRKAIALLQDHG